jgi:hypothetical protein
MSKLVIALVAFCAIVNIAVCARLPIAGKRESAPFGWTLINEAVPEQPITFTLLLK